MGSSHSREFYSQLTESDIPTFCAILQSRTKCNVKIMLDDDAFVWDGKNLWLIQKEKSTKCRIFNGRLKKLGEISYVCSINISSTNRGADFFLDHVYYKNKIFT